MKPTTRLGRTVLARSPSAWLTPRSMRFIRRRALPAAPPRIGMGRYARAAGARCASSSGPFASGSARRSSRISAKGSSRHRRWPIRRPSAGLGRWRGSRMGRPARSCIGSNIPTARSFPGQSPVGWLARGPTFWPTPTSWRRSRCTPCGCGAGSSTKPPHWRRKSRGKREGRAILAALRRIKATRSQVGLSRTQRAENVQGAFRIAESAVVRDLNVVLVDDVLTSGATANAASRALLRAGAKRVDVLVFARVVTAA